MARHDQKPAESKYICTACRANCCDQCMDVLRLQYKIGPPLCACKHKMLEGAE